MISSLITPACVIPRLLAQNTKQAIQYMADVASDSLLVGRDELQYAMLTRAEISSFGFGQGIAVPHVSVARLQQPSGFFARLLPAHDFGASDALPVDLVFLLLSPEGADTTHLRSLACVVRRLRDREVAARLRKADSAEAIYAILTSNTWRSADKGAGTINGLSAGAAMGLSDSF
jgi:PTS system nitrogen regulatory IIA component